VIGRARHLREDRLYECYLAAQAGEALDPPSAEHLADCTACQARYAELEGFLDVVRGEAEAETNEIFTAEHLVHQREQILRRVDHLHRAARVISFPGGPPPQAIYADNRFAPRWVAMGAAAGLFVGMVVGGTMFSRESRLRADRPMQVVTAPAPRSVQPAVLVNNPMPVVETIDDDVFISQLEMALARPRTRELMPFDALTPHVRDQRQMR
jgi:hypothetical protein